MTRLAASRTASDSWSRSSRPNSSPGSAETMAAASAQPAGLNSDGRSGSAEIVSGGSNMWLGVLGIPGPFVTCYPASF